MVKFSKATSGMQSDSSVNLHGTHIRELGLSECFESICMCHAILNGTKFQSLAESTQTPDFTKSISIVR